MSVGIPCCKEFTIVIKDDATECNGAFSDLAFLTWPQSTVGQYNNGFVNYPDANSGDGTGSVAASGASGTLTASCGGAIEDYGNVAASAFFWNNTGAVINLRVSAVRTGDLPLLGVYLVNAFGESGTRIVEEWDGGSGDLRFNNPIDFSVGPCGILRISFWAICRSGNVTTTLSFTISILP